VAEDNKNRRRRKFTPEFKRDAVALVTDTGRSIAEVARDLGIYDSTLGNWVKAARAEEEEDNELSPDERERFRELEAEVLELRRERDLLKRSVAFWVKETSTR
jgi:transposase